MEVELVDKIERLFEIEKDWNELLDQSPVKDIFLTPLWICSWWKIFGEGKDLFVVILWEDKQLCGLFPLYKFKKGPFNIITFIGLPKHSDRMDLVLLPGYEEKNLRAFSQWIIARSDWDLMVLKNFGPFSKTPELFNEIWENGKRKPVLAPEQPCYFISIKDYKGFEDYLKSTFRQKRIRDFRRVGNKLKQLPMAEWKVLNHIDYHLLDQMEELDSKRSVRGLAGSSFFLNKPNKVFLKDLIAKLESQDRIRMFTFLTENRLCSYLLTFRFADKILAYQTAFDKELYSCDVGNLTFLEGIRYTFDNGYTEWDFLIGDDSYKSRWTEKYRQNKSLLVYNRGIKSSLLYFYQNRIKPIRSRVKNYRLVQKLMPESLKKLDI